MSEPTITRGSQPGSLVAWVLFILWSIIVITVAENIDINDEAVTPLPNYDTDNDTSKGNKSRMRPH